MSFDLDVRHGCSLEPSLGNLRSYGQEVIITERQNVAKVVDATSNRGFSRLKLNFAKLYNISQLFT